MVVMRRPPQEGAWAWAASVPGHNGYNGVSRGAYGSYLNDPNAIAVDNNGYLYISGNNFFVRVVYLLSNEE